MTTKSVKLSSLEGLTIAQINTKLSGVLDASIEPPNGSLKYLQEKVHRFETNYGMKSEEMMAAVSSGELPETEALATWAIDYSLLQELSGN